METKAKISIKNWAEDDKPREKLINKGKNALSDAELIAILIGSGSNSESAVELSKRILQSVENNLVELSKLDISRLIEFKGIGEAKAISIIASLELGRRRRESDTLEKPVITTSQDAFNIIYPVLVDISYEQFWIALLNKANKLIKRLTISEGGLSATVVDPKKIFKFAIEGNASSIILYHNHPSGNINPSNEDIQITTKIKEAGKFLDLPILDHLIIADDKYFSFADEGLI